MKDIDNKLSSKTIIVCGIVRDCEKNLSRNLQIIERFCELFKKYDIVIYENDSKDNTKNILKKFSEKNNNIHISINSISNEPSIPESDDVLLYKYNTNKRIKKMAYYRNKYLEYIEENNIVADYIMVVDLDVSKIYFNGLLSSFYTTQNWDVITANGYAFSNRLKRRYFDTYALCECGLENVPITSESLMINQYKWGFMKFGMPLFKVYCAHGGISIYRYEVIRGLRYIIVPNYETRIEVKCEHFGLLKQIHDNGYHEVYINPSMLVKYRSINLNLIITKIKDLFR